MGMHTNVNFTDTYWKAWSTSSTWRTWKSLVTLKVVTVIVNADDSLLFGLILANVITEEVCYAITLNAL